jgi:hypothetical protein
VVVRAAARRSVEVAKRLTLHTVVETPALRGGYILRVARRAGAFCGRTSQPDCGSPSRKRVAYPICIAEPGARWPSGRAGRGRFAKVHYVRTTTGGAPLDGWPSSPCRYRDRRVGTHSLRQIRVLRRAGQMGRADRYEPSG